MTKIALLYDDDAYVETVQRTAPARAGGPVGLMGRQVAGKEFLDAYLTHGSWSEMVGLVRNRASAQSLANLWRTHSATRDGSRKLQLVEEQQFHKLFFPPAATILHVPGPLEARYAWARQHAGPGAYALSGITHTICSAPVMQAFCNLVTAPFEPADTLICTTRTAVEVVRTVTGLFADYLRDRHGGAPASPVRLEVIPLGVNAEKFRPPTPQERKAQRQSLQIDDGEIVVMFVGRLSFHAKAHPFPMFAGLARAAELSGRKIRLILSGWAANQAIMDAFVEGARVLAPRITTTVVESLKPDKRFAIWHVADIVTSLSDNIQETFGLTIVEAMASGLPVVASEWDGYRDIVVHGETGYLIPTFMIEGATAEATSRLLMGEVDYDHFLAASNQSVAVDQEEAAQAYAQLINDAGLRQQMGTAGRKRVLERFAWPVVIRAYETLWQGQEEERAAYAARAPAPLRRGPAIYPAPEYSFAAYPTAVLRASDQLRVGVGAAERIELFLRMPLTNYADFTRSKDSTALRAAINAAATAKTVAELDAVLQQAGVPAALSRPTLAWMLKYGLLKRG